MPVLEDVRKLTSGLLKICDTQHKRIGIFTIISFAESLFHNGCRGWRSRNGNPLGRPVYFQYLDKPAQLYDQAEETAKWNIVDNFGGYQVLVEGAEYKNVWLETQPMGGVMYANRNLEIARNNILIFMDHQRDDGRFPGMIHCTEGKISPYYDNLVGMQRVVGDQLTLYYGWLQGYCPDACLELYFWLGKERGNAQL